MGVSAETGADVLVAIAPQEARGVTRAPRRLPPGDAGVNISAGPARSEDRAAPGTRRMYPP